MSFQSLAWLRDWQIGDGSEDGNLERAEAKLLWEDVRMIVECDRPQTSKLKDLLLLAVAKISDEMNMCQLPLLQSTTLAELLPYTKSAVECVSMLGSVLIMEPEGRPRQHSLTTALVPAHSLQ